MALDDALASLYDNVHMKAELAVVKDRMVGQGRSTYCCCCRVLLGTLNRTGNRLGAKRQVPCRWASAPCIGDY